MDVIDEIKIRSAFLTLFQDNFALMAPEGRHRQKLGQTEARKVGFAEDMEPRSFGLYPDDIHIVSPEQVVGLGFGIMSSVRINRARFHMYIRSKSAAESP